MPSFLDSLTGRKPVVPPVPVVDLGAEQAKAVKENLAVAPEAAKLATLSQDQINKMMEMAIPGFANLRGQVASNLASRLRGEIPGDVSLARRQQSAGTALAGGYGGTDASRRLEARDLGLTSLGIQQQAESSAEKWMGAMEQLYSPSQALFTGMFITPQQQYAATSHERDLQYQQQWLQEQINAMPAPWAEDLKQFVYRAMSVYSGTPVDKNPYSTPGAFGGGGAGGGPGAGAGVNWGASDWSANDNTTNTPWDWSGSTPMPQSGGAAGLLGGF